MTKTCEHCGSVFSTNEARSGKGRFCSKACARTIHGGTETAEYKAWKEMRQRCLNANHQNYRDYGGRGITVHQRWQSFDAFLSDVGKRPTPAHTLDRKDPNGHYEPGNVRWATRLEQAINRRNTKQITCDGITKPLSVWARELGVSYFTLRSRLDIYGWEPERVLREALFEKQAVDKETVTTLDAAKSLGVSQRTVYAWIKSGRLSCVIVRGLKRVPKSCLFLEVVGGGTEEEPEFCVQI